MNFIISVILILKDKIRIIETAAKLIVEISGKQYQQAAVHQHAWQLPGKKSKVYHARGDADVLIVQKAVELATLMDTALVGEDTDLLILLCYHANLDSHNIFFRPEPKKNTKKPRLWSIKVVKEQLGPEICSNILFLHAVLGCDTTSHLYGIGRGTSLKKIKLSRHFRQIICYRVSNPQGNLHCRRTSIGHFV